MGNRYKETKKNEKGFLVSLQHYLRTLRKSPFRQPSISQDAPQDIRRYYLKDDVVFKFDVHHEECRDILLKLLVILNLNDMEKALRGYLDLLTFYGKDNLEYILENTTLKSTGKTLKQSFEYRRFLEYKKTVDIRKYDVIIGFSEGYPKESQRDRWQNAIYSTDYVIEGKNEGLHSILSLDDSSDPFSKVYQEINHGILYDQVDLLIKHVDFIQERKCYHFLFKEYPVLLDYVPKNEVPTKPYVRERVN